MAFICSVCGFRVFGTVLWMFLAVFLKKALSEPVHLMSVTPTPFVSNDVEPAQFICLLSDPDTAKLNEITIGRHITRGNTSAYNTLALPSRTTSTTVITLNRKTTTIATTTHAVRIGEVQGVFYCEASNSQGVPTRVPVTILRGDQTHFEPLDGQFTVTANVGESVTLDVTILTSNTPLAVNPSTDVRWQKQADTPDGYITFDQSRFTSTADSLSFPINQVTVSDKGVYATYWKDRRQSFRFSLIRLIVRECPAGRWGPPTCISICDNCYNGGICDDKTGECVCRPGFTGPNCLRACGQNKFGWDCEHQCGFNLAVASCPLSVFCVPDPAGCSCIPGWKGTKCDQVCLNDEFGAGCSETCHCAEGVACDRYTGECATGNCAAGWSGTGCQIPDECPTGYWGSECTEKCGCENCNQDTGSCLLASECLSGFAGHNCEHECHCLSGPSCVDRMTAKCSADDNTGLSLCEPGYMSVTGINLDNCAQYEGCFADCTKTCHCQGGVNHCNPVTGECSTPASDGKMCKDAWSGTSCQTGIISLTYQKTNPGQPVNVTCIVTGDPGAPDASRVSLFYLTDQGGFENGDQVETMQKGNYLSVVYEASPAAGGELTCSETTEGFTQAKVTTEYYALPRLTDTPTIVPGSVGATSVMIQWNAWDPAAGDTGDGPVIGYNIYYALKSMPGNRMDGGFISGLDQTQSEIIQVIVESLQPSTEYWIQVRAVREGPGGEGQLSPVVDITTLALTTLPPSTSSPRITTSSPSTSSPHITTQPPSILSSQPPSQVGPTQTTTASGVVNMQSAQTSIIVAVVMILLVILAFIIALIFYIRWRRRRQPKRYPPSVVASEADLDRISQVLAPSMFDTSSVASLENFINLGFEESTDDMDFENRRPISHPAPPPPPLQLSPDSPALRKRAATSTIKLGLHISPVDVKDFANYVKKKRLSTDLKVEWESLPKGLVKPTTIAKKLENKGKNRFRNVVAYDHSRVGLEPLEYDPHSDYINACYIKGIKNKKHYIATQGPSDMTLGDFWRLIWQEEVAVVVMACNLIEEGKQKCSKYWPDINVPVSFGGISVSLNGEEKKGKECTIRRLTASKDGEEGSRELTQIHYTEWPDKDVPKHCTPVLKYIKQVKKHHNGKTPLLIHCSAGAGRTGTIIAIHAMMDLADSMKQVDIYNFVCSMRNNRPHMVQTSDQYIFVHDALLEYLFCKETFVSADEFAARLKSLQETNPETGNTYLQDEYEILNLVSPNHGALKTRGSLSQEGLARMRTADNLPVDSSRPLLMTPRGDDDKSGFINAAFLDGYKKKDLFISTQMPLTHTVVDIWRMMYDYNCTSIVHLNDMDQEDCPQFWPDTGTNEYGPFTVSLMGKENTPDYDMRTLQLVYTKMDMKSPISVRHFQYKTWPRGDERPATSDGILQLISAVEKWQKTLDAPGPIVVLCMNAAGRTGVFCAIQTCLDQVREEQGVDVLQNVKQLRIHRTNVVDTPSKYLFCYEAILEYLKAFDINYDNSIPYENITRSKMDNEEDIAGLYGNMHIGARKKEKGDRTSRPAASLPQSETKQEPGGDETKSDALNKDNKARKDELKVPPSTRHNQANGTPSSERKSRYADDEELRLYGNIPSSGTPKVDRKATDAATNPAPPSNRRSRIKADKGERQRNNSQKKSSGKKPKEGEQIYQNTVFEAYAQV
ncbi:uncharacterized protein [Amphiura filiformis]|uniref:uncharacterized protein n=1 Tax=Amphiura filiformis TaxID=82378 RepID=UPI003B21A6F6